ncbi:CgeB family protein [Bradyrhizobium aeschynomenes]|uniref:CgeB family protein n=1 Tax=Bradyrhizobium aeschynomenes TaxID=2734909 RepID=UPI0015567454|nr:glycosyltransferase [Bradyrhizobium aeschynomenes]NPV23536.1 glycosyltransferase [Bradyrhizobium aeschynomenes]
MKCVLFYHAFSSCWNNGNAHFLRGVARELHALGHEVIVYEPADGWSRLNAIKDGGNASLREVPALFPGLHTRVYDCTLELDEALDGADLVLVHEWNEPDLVKAIGRRRIADGRFVLLFHDTHHRAVTAPHELGRFDLTGYDGVLAFGEVLREIYLTLGWTSRAFTWHEAADTALYRPLPDIEPQHDLVWIGNWGDNERSAELREFLVAPVASLQLDATIYGVRYPEDALTSMRQAGIRYGGWLPAHRAPQAFAEARVTVHVPRAPYARSLPGIPTIRMFEAMACGIPIVSAPWDDVEGLFPEGTYLRVTNGSGMRDAVRTLLSDREFATDMAATARGAVLARHTCRHRAQELLQIAARLNRADRRAASAQFEGAAS